MSMIIWPSLALFIAAIWALILPRTIASIVALLASFIGMLLLLNLQGNEIQMIFAWAFWGLTTLGVIYGFGRMEGWELASALVYAGSALSVVFANDFYHLFIYWELMAIASTALVLSGRSEEARRAALRYGAVHFLGGAFLLAGIAGYVQATGSADLPSGVLVLGDFWAQPYGWMMLAGIVVNLAAPPFSAWVADSYAKASPYAAMFLSGITTKTAIFVLLSLFGGMEVIALLGLVIAAYGLLYAFLAYNLRQYLSYSIVVQLGLMMVGIGLGAGFAVAVYAAIHIAYKALLFAGAGVIETRGQSTAFLSLRLHFVKEKFLYIALLFGALTLTAAPFTASVVSKTLLSDALYQAGAEWVYYAVMAIGAGVVISFPWHIFSMEKGMGKIPSPPSGHALMVMSTLMAVLLFVGLAYPRILAYSPISFATQLHQAELLLGAGLIAFLFRHSLIVLRKTTYHDMDWLYRGLAMHLIRLGELLWQQTETLGTRLMQESYTRLRDVAATYHSGQGIFARSWPIGISVLVAASLLGVYLVLYYI